MDIGGNLSINGGDASADVAINHSQINGNTRINTGHDDDRIQLFGTRFEGDLTIQTESGDDWIGASGDVFVGGDFKFIGGQGEDDATSFLDAASVDGAIKLLQVEIT